MYTHRFAPLAVLETPPFVPYDNFAAQTELADDPNAVRAEGRRWKESEGMNREMKGKAG